MKTWLLAIALFASTAIHAEEPEKVSFLSSKVALKNGSGYFALSDGTCWKMVPFSKRWRSISEWWNNVTIVPKNYESTLDDWLTGTEVEVYSKDDHLTTTREAASNLSDIQQCTHAFVNKRTGHIFFAVALHPATCLVQLHQEALAEGYQKGLVEGRLSAYQNANQIYNDGYEKGRQMGYAEGCKAMRDEDQPGSVR